MPGTETRERSPLTRERILRTAVQLMDAEGLEALSMRRLGRELGVEAMSLYNHVADKEAILVGIVETVLAEFRLSPTPPATWTDQLWQLAYEFRRVLLRHPNVIRLIAEHHGPPTDPRSFEPVEAALATLRAAGLSPEETIHAYRLLVGFVMGYVTLETGGLFSEDAAAMKDHEAFLRAAAERLPTTVEMLPFMMECDPGREFEHGLDTLLTGLEARMGPARRAPG